MTQATSVRLPDELDHKLAELSSATGRSKSFYIREAVERSLDEMAFVYGLLQQREDVRAGRIGTRPWTEVRAEMGFEPATDAEIAEALAELD